MLFIIPLYVLVLPFGQFFLLSNTAQPSVLSWSGPLTQPYSGWSDVAHKKGRENHVINHKSLRPGRQQHHAIHLSLFHSFCPSFLFLSLIPPLPPSISLTLNLPSSLFPSILSFLPLSITLSLYPSFFSRLNPIFPSSTSPSPHFFLLTSVSVHDSFVQMFTVV